MFRVFKGNWRGLGNEPEGTVFINIGVDFRQYLYYFKGAKLHVLLAIALHMDENGVAYPSYDALEKQTGYGRGTVAKALDELCEMEIEGQPVVTRWRVRDEKGQYTGSNRYILFPTADEVQSSENPTLEKSNGGKTELEQEPVTKQEPSSKGASATINTSLGDVLHLLEQPKANATALVVKFAAERFGAGLAGDFSRAGAVIRGASGVNGRVKPTPADYKAAAGRVLRALEEASAVEPPPHDVWTYVQAMTAEKVVEPEYNYMEDLHVKS